MTLFANQEGLINSTCVDTMRYPGRYRSRFRLCFACGKCSTEMRQRRPKPKAPGEDSPASRLTPDEVRARAFQRAVKLLAAKPRSIAELRERLAERCPSKTVIETVIARLREYGYLDDERYALGYASSKVRQQPIGRRRLELSLDRKKVDRAVADEALDQVFAETPEEELLDRALEKRVRLRGRPKTRAEAKSLFDHLLRQGFPFELVSQKVRAVSKANLDDTD
jgi:regulatory protein